MSIKMKILIILLVIITLTCADQQKGRIVGGFYAPNGPYSYMAALRNETQGVICGGAIVRNFWLLSAATCKDATYVSIGSNYLDQQWFFKIAQKVIHPAFDNKTLLNNIMLIKTNLEMPYYYYYSTTYNRITPIYNNCDGKIDTNTSLPMAFSGWGEYSPSSPVSPRLLHANFTLFNETYCLNRSLASNQKLTFDSTTQLCGTTGLNSPAGSGICYADVGSPLVWEGYIIGIASRIMNTPCGSEFPDVFTRASAYCTWIYNTIASL